MYGKESSAQPSVSFRDKDLVSILKL